MNATQTPAHRVHPAARERRTPTVVASRYRCPLHPEQPVTPKNTGCPDCTPRPIPRSEKDWTY